MNQNKYIADFMKTFPHEGLTFDDVSLITQYADFLPGDTDIASKLTRNVGVKIPFLSAAMDTVTEAKMAISMAMLGGIGVIHKNLDPEKQAQRVSRVKHHLNGLITDPITFNVGDDIVARDACAEVMRAFFAAGGLVDCVGQVTLCTE